MTIPCPAHIVPPEGDRHASIQYLFNVFSQGENNMSLKGVCSEGGLGNTGTTVCVCVCACVCVCVCVCVRVCVCVQTWRHWWCAVWGTPW